MAYIKDHSLYYQGEPTQYALLREIARESGDEAHYNLFKHLLSNSITLKHTTAKYVYLLDQVAAQSCLFILPTNLQVLIAILLNQWEKYTLDQMSLRYEGYLKKSNILEPNQIIDLNSKILNLPLSTTLNSVLSIETDYTNINLLNDFFGFDLDLFKADYTINRQIQSEFNVCNKVEQIFNYFSYSNSFSEDFLSIVKNGDRLKSLYYICSALNYSTRAIKSLVAILEIWEIDHT